ncbi:hypothetical protein RSAG8_03307, partial [Rhizoctonia solani AG-8 WAC10335]
MSHPLFHLPEMVRLICEMLDRPSLVRLLTVSRRLFDIAAPLVWENIADSDVLYIFIGLHHRVVYCFKEKRVKKSENLGMLHGHFRDRWNTYAPLVKHLSRNFGDEPSDWTWDALLPNATSLPFPPNLQVLEFSVPREGKMSPIEFVSQLRVHLGPNLTRIYHRSGEWESVDFLHTPKLVKTITQHCPSVRTLQLFIADSGSSVTKNELRSLAQHLEKLSDLRTLGLGSIALEPVALTSLGNLSHLKSLTISTGSLAQHLEKLSDLHTLGLGSIALEPVALTSLGNLSHLESLTISTGWVQEPWPSPPSGNVLCPESFPALRHLGIGCRNSGVLDIASRLWEMPTLVQRLTSISLTLVININQGQDGGEGVQNLICSISQSSPNVTDLHLKLIFKITIHDQITQLPRLRLFSPKICAALKQLPLQRDGGEGVQNLICSISQSSPNVTDLHLKLIFKITIHDQITQLPRLRLFSPKICAALKQLPLQRVIIALKQNRITQIDLDCRELALALPKAEFLLLDIAKHRLSFEDFELLAQHMKKLQHLVAGFDHLHWPEEYAPLATPGFSPSPSTLYFDGTVQELDLGDGDRGEVQRVAKALHQLWPNGVCCSLRLIDQKEESFWARLNNALATLRASEGLDRAAAKSRGSEWKYITQKTTPEISSYIYRHLFE